MLTAYMPTLRKPFNNSTDWYKNFYNIYYLSQVTNLTLLSYMESFIELHKNSIIDIKHNEFLKRKIVSENKNKDISDWIINDEKKFYEEIKSFDIEQGLNEIFEQQISKRFDDLNSFIMPFGTKLNDDLNKEISINFNEIKETTNAKNWYQVITGFLNIWEFLFLFSTTEHTLKTLLSYQRSDDLFLKLLESYPALNFKEKGFISNDGYKVLWQLYNEVRNLYSHTHGILVRKLKDKINSKTHELKVFFNDDMHIMDSSFLSEEKVFNNNNLIENKFYLLNDEELNLFRNFVIVTMESLDEFIANNP